MPKGLWELGPPWLAGSDKEGGRHTLYTALKTSAVSSVTLQK